MLRFSRSGAFGVGRINGKRLRRHLLLVLLVASLTIFYCEYLIYYLALWTCRWPDLKCAKTSPDDGTSSDIDEAPLRALILSDPHVFSPWAHWLDKLRREWQMGQSFKAAMAYLHPDVVFMLGDILDKGHVTAFRFYGSSLVQFRKIFAIPPGVPLICAAGNHDMGFHYEIYYESWKHFEKTFQSRSVKLFSMKGVDFVILNSMAFEGDSCEMCKEAEDLLKNVSDKLQAKRRRAPCVSSDSSCASSGPVVMQHFPLFRKSDEVCPDDDEEPQEARSSTFRAKWECLSEDASDKILRMLEPRAIFGGHTHHSCYRIYQSEKAHVSVPEWSISSFNWRNKNNPSFLAVSFCPLDFKVQKCHLPRESTVFTVYIVSGVFLLFYLGMAIFKCRPRKDKV